MLNPSNNKKLIDVGCGTGDIASLFIKTTSKHFPDGHLFYKNLKIKNKKIDNTKIYNLIKNFFS